MTPYLLCGLMTCWIAWVIAGILAVVWALLITVALRVMAIARSGSDDE